MAFYNSAALAGGASFAKNLAMAGREVAGGWDLGPGFLSTNADEVFAEAMSQKGIPELMERIKTRYNVAAIPGGETALNIALASAYKMDSAMMVGNKDIAKDVTERIKAIGPFTKKVYDALRRMIHRGGTKPLRYKRGERMRALAVRALGRKNRRDALAGHAWYGSDPYLPGSRSTAHTYQGIYPAWMYPRRNMFGQPIAYPEVPEATKTARALKRARYESKVQNLMNSVAAPWTVPPGYNTVIKQEPIKLEALVPPDVPAPPPPPSVSGDWEFSGMYDL